MAARWPRKQQLSFHGRELFDLSHRIGAGAKGIGSGAKAGASMVVPVICVMLLLVGTAAANFSNGGEGSTPATAAGSGQWSGTAARGELRPTLVLAQRMDKSQSAEASRRPATGPQGPAAPREQQRAPPELHGHETRSSVPAEPDAGQAVSETERINQQLQLDQERRRREQLARELTSVRAELDAARQLQAHTARAIEIGIQQTQALEQEREKTNNLSRELSFLRAELDVAQVAASKSLQAPDIAVKQECAVDRRNGAKRFVLQLTSLRSELDVARNAASEATRSASTEAEHSQALERELKQEQDKTEALINELSAVRTSASKTVAISTANAAETQALRGEIEKQRGNADRAVRQLDSLHTELRTARAATSELVAHHAADVEHQGALERDVEQQRSRADSLAREATSLKNERDAARAEALDAARTAEATANARAACEKEQAAKRETLSSTRQSFRDQLAAWNAFAAASPRGDQGRQSIQSVVESPAPPSSNLPASAATPPNARLTTGSSPSTPDTKAPERITAAGAAPLPAASEERLLARAVALLRQSDINGARGLLEYMLGHGSARAAFMLAETYDPHMLQSWDARGVAGDTTKARELYERARAGGIQAADGRIKGL